MIKYFEAYIEPVSNELAEMLKPTVKVIKHVPVRSVRVRGRKIVVTRFPLDGTLADDLTHNVIGECCRLGYCTHLDDDEDWDDR